MADAILARWKEYTHLQQRKAAAILGALVADAAGRLIAVMMCTRVSCQALFEVYVILSNQHDQNHTLIEIIS